MMTLGSWYPATWTMGINGFKHIEFPMSEIFSLTIRPLLCNVYNGKHHFSHLSK